MRRRIDRSTPGEPLPPVRPPAGPPRSLEIQLLQLQRQATGSMRMQMLGRPSDQTTRRASKPRAKAKAPASAQRQAAPGSQTTPTMPAGYGPMSPEALRLLQQQAGNKAVSHLPGLGAPMTAEQQQPPSLPIYDRTTRQKKLVDAESYELERQQLGRRLRYLVAAISKDAEEVLDAYPYESIGDKYKECGEKLQDAGRHYARGNLLLAGMWAWEAGKYTDLEGEAHRIFETEGFLSHLGKRLAFAVVGFFEGAADALLGLVDQGAGLIGYHPGLVEWNTNQYEQIKGGLGSLTNIEHTHIHDDEIGRMGGRVAAGLAIGKTLQSGGIGGTAVMIVAAAGGIKSTAENIAAMHQRGRSWGDIFSDPVVLAQCAGALAGATIAGAGIQPLREFFRTAGLVLTAAQISTATVAIATLDNDKTLSADEKYQKMLDLLGDALLNAGMTADGLAAGRADAPATTEALPSGATKALPAGTAEPGAVAAETPAATRPDIHERFDVSDVEPVAPHERAPDPHEIAPEELAVGDRHGEQQPGRGKAGGEDETPTPAAPRPGERVTTRVPGVYEAADPNAAAPRGFRLVDEIQAFGNMVEIDTKVTTPSGAKGHARRSVELDTNRVAYESANLEDIPPGERWIPTDPPMVAGRGTPLEAYLSMRQMRIFEQRGASLAGPRTVIMRSVMNVRSGLELARAEQGGKIPTDTAIMETQSVQYASNSIIQRGERIVAARVEGGSEEPATLVGATPDEIAAYGLPPDVKIKMGYDIYLDVEPVTATTPAPSSAGRGTGTKTGTGDETQGGQR